jgi:hypothetical protein
MRFIKKIYSYFKCLYSLDKRLRRIEKLVDIGVDYSQYGGSWAVICLRGKPEYVHFVRGDVREMKQLRDFLKSYQHANLTIDLPYPMRDMELLINP